MEPADTYGAGGRNRGLKRKFVWGLSATSKSHQLAIKGGEFCGFIKQVSSMHLLVTNHPCGKTSLHHSSFPLSGFTSFSHSEGRRGKNVAFSLS